MVTAVGLCRRDIVMAYRALEHPMVGWIGAGRMGVALAEQDKFDEAIAAYRQALEIKPNYLDALANLGI